VAVAGLALAQESAPVKLVRVSVVLGVTHVHVGDGDALASADLQAVGELEVLLDQAAERGCEMS
jgi:hypothetical protein